MKNGSRGPDYKTIIPRSIAAGSCAIGMMQLLVATFVVVCAFVMFGGFCDKLQCSDISSGIGLWLGFPLILPALMSVIVLGTRHRLAVITSVITNFLVGILAIVHAVLTKGDEDDVWSVHLKAYNDNDCVSQFPGKCLCTVTGVTKLFPYGCDLIEFGSDVNWILFVLSILTILLCLISVILSAIGLSKRTVTPRKR